ncbi:MAG: hypothetical protein ACI9YE_000977 [Psychroserpens sp.]|jgi:hypothetical protein
MNIKEKFIPSKHKLLVSSSFVDYSTESKCFFITAFFFRVIGGLRSRWAYKRAEDYVKKNFPFVYQSQKIARKDGGLTGEYQWVRLAEIAKIIKFFGIKSVCEFGSGGSTTMFAELKLNKSITLEQSEKWAARTRDILPKDTSLELLRRDRLVEDFDGEPCTRYDLSADFYKQEFDLLYIDGPTAKAMTDEEKALPILDQPAQTMPNIDVELFFANGSYPKVILVDARRATVRRLCEKYGEKYDIFMRYYYKDKADRSGAFFYHTLFVRR